MIASLASPSSFLLIAKVELLFIPCKYFAKYFIKNMKINEKSPKKRVFEAKIAKKRDYLVIFPVLIFAGSIIQML